MNGNLISQTHAAQVLPPIMESKDPESNTVAYLIFAILFLICYELYYYFKKKLAYFEELNVPYVPGWPIVGNMGATIFGQKHFGEVVDDIYNHHPKAKYVGAFDFMRETIVIRDPELIKTITIKNFEHFSDHQAFINREMDPLLGGSMFYMTGQRWREARSLLSPAFTSSKMKGMFRLMVDSAKNYVGYLSKQTLEANRVVDTKNLFSRYTNDVIATCAFGIEVDSLNNPENDFYINGRKATTLEGAMTIKFFISRALPKILKLFKIKFINDQLANFFTNVVRSAVTTRDEKALRRPDMLQLMMDARDRSSEHFKLDIDEMTSQAFSFYFGGFDTASTQMCVIAHELALNPMVQQKLQEEIDGVLKNGEPSYEAINEMPYLDAVVNESLRRHTQAALIDRLCTKEFELPPALPGKKPFTVKPGMYVLIPAPSIHRDPKHYENPLKFNPNRYYQKKIGVNDATNLGFGIGPRACIGYRFAILEIKILFFYLLSEFNLVPNEKTTLKYSTKSFTVAVEGGFWLSIVPRGERSL